MASGGEARRDRSSVLSGARWGHGARTLGAPRRGGRLLGASLRSLARGAAGTVTAVFLHSLGERGDLCALLIGLPHNPRSLYF